MTTLGFALFAGTAPGLIPAAAREAEGLGYGSFWLNHPGAVPANSAKPRVVTATNVY